MRVLLADDHPLFVDGLRNLLAARGIEVVGTARDGLEAVDRARAYRPEMVLMDIKMPRLDGLAAMRLIKAEFPEIKVVMLTMSAEDDDLYEAIKSGACGYLLKTQDTAELLVLLEDAARGELALSPGLAARILQELGRRAPAHGRVSAPLSPRERQVLTLVAQGMTYKEAAASLFLSERTIKYHMRQIVERLHLANRAEVVEYARRAGLVE